MRFGKMAGLTAGALVASALSVPAFMGAAQAAPTSATAAVNQDCTVAAFGNTMVTAFNQPLTISADGTAVSVPTTASGVLHNVATGAALSNFKMESVTFTVNATVNGEAVALTGTTTRAAGSGVSLADPLALPALSGTRTGTTAVTAATVTSMAIDGTLWVPYGGPAGSRAPVALSCAAAQDTEIKQALQCTFDTFSFVYPAVIKTRTSPKVARIESVTPFKSGMPAFVPVSKLAATFNGTVAGTPLVTKAPATTFDPAAPGNTGFVLPATYALRTGVSDVATSDVKVTGATVVMTSGGSDSTVNCVPTGWPTVTTLTATSPAPGKVNLVASIDASDAVGTVQFKDGANNVASSAVVSGGATAALTGVLSGNHSYTAVFVPTDAAVFAGSSSAAVVQAVVTQACVDSKAALPGAQAGVTNANAAAVAATAGVKAATAKAASTSKAYTKAKKAEAKAKKATKKKASKAKKAKAKKAYAKAKKATAKAKKAAATAASQLKTANAASAAANAKVATATAAVTAAQAAVAKNC